MTTEIYINRKLTLVKGKERTEIEEAELKADRLPLVVLGDAGMGKSRLLQSLAERFSSRRISAGSFVRGANVEAFKPSKGSPIIIDGLDEVAVSHGRSAVDEVLSKLSALDYPPFVLSCRVADWEGAAARHKIAEDYGTDPVVVNLAPFAERDAIAYLNALCLDASAIVADLDKRDLSEFYQNPLTLTLLAKVVRECGGLPTGKADLLDRSARLLLREDNELHKVDPVAKAPEDDLLAAAGAVFAHLLLSGTSGVTTLTPTDAPPGYISTGEVQSLEAGLGAAVVGTRVFRATEEGLFLPFHRVIAEYTAGRWLAAKLDDGISERRLLQLFVVDGGVPTALRGTFAWLGHFAPRLVDDCIRADPYGMLRYGDAEKLPLPQAHLLLRSLNELAEEDPYFRSEDWGRSGIRGIGRVELKDDVLAILRNPERRLHLSTLILEALRGTPLSKALEPELVALLENEAAVFVERSNAGEALAASHSDVDWPGVLTRLVAGNDDSRRLAIELMGELGPNRFDPSFIADMLIGYHRILEEGEHEDEDIVGVDYLLVKRLAATTGAAVLDELAKKISPTFRTRHEELKRRARAVMVRIAVNSLDALDYNQPAPVWRWLRYLSGEFPIHREELDRIAAAITRNAAFRYELQRCALQDHAFEPSPVTRVFSCLRLMNPMLGITGEEAARHLREFSARDVVSKEDAEEWGALVRLCFVDGALSTEANSIVHEQIAKHPLLADQWAALTAPPTYDWRAEDERSRREYEERQSEKIAKDRKHFLQSIGEIEAGRPFNNLYILAATYLGEYMENKSISDPVERVRRWAGDDLYERVLDGFVASLWRNDLPSPRDIAEAHSSQKRCFAEPIVIAGIAEHLRRGGALSSVPRTALETALSGWWEMPDFEEQGLGTDLGARIEDQLFSDDEAIKSFIEAVVEPRIGAKDTHVPGLYRLQEDEKFANVAGNLAIGWVKRYPDAKPEIQRELFQIALVRGEAEPLIALARERLSTTDSELQRWWMSILFLLDFDASKGVFEPYFLADRDTLWGITTFIRRERGRRMYPLSPVQMEFIITTFAGRWPPAGFPRGGAWGSEHSWDASSFLTSLIDALGANVGNEAAGVLARLSEDPRMGDYRDHARHMRKAQERLKRDTAYNTPSFREVKAALENALPQTIDDLKAVTLDALDRVQNYLRNGDTKAWLKYWNGGKPLTENDCRDRLLDDLRAKLPSAIAALPETKMPDDKRTDIAVILGEFGLPIEAKGQWHKDIWDAPSGQLIDLYTKDYRANQRGVYLVFWFGNVAGKKLAAHPDGLTISSPQSLRAALIERLPISERGRVDVVVLDLSPTGS